MSQPSPTAGTTPDSGTTSSQTLHVRPLTPADLPAVLSLLKESYPTAPAKGELAHFQWQFLNSPLGSAAETYLLAWQGQQLIGQLGTMRDRLWIGGAWREALWLVDLFVLPEHRNSLAGLRLLQALMNRTELLLTVGAGPAMEPLYASLGWRRLPIAKTFYLPIRPAGLLRMAESTGREVAGSLVKLAAGGAERVLPRLVKSLAAPTAEVAGQLRCEELASFTEEWRPFFQSATETAQVTPFRNTERLAWKIQQHPEQPGIIWQAKDSHSNALRGMLAARVIDRSPVARWLEIVDYLVSPADHAPFCSLLAAATATALQQKLDFIRIRLSLPEHQALLPKPWWREHTLPVTDEVFAHHADNALLEQLSQQPWHLTSLVSDRAEDGRRAN